MTPTFFFFRKCSRCHPDLRMLPTHSFFSNMFVFTFFNQIDSGVTLSGVTPRFFSPKITLGVTPFCDASKHSFFSYIHINNFFFFFFSQIALGVTPLCVNPFGSFSAKKILSAIDFWRCYPLTFLFYIYFLFFLPNCFGCNPLRG